MEVFVVENKIEKLYANYYSVLRNGNHDEGVDLEIKTMCFLNILNNDLISINDLDLSDHGKFNRVMEREFSKQSDHKVKDVLVEIIKTGMFNHREELNIVNKKISELDNTTRIQLFNYDKDRTASSASWTTSKDIISLILQLVDVRKFQSILDLCSGKGTFLNECACINPDAKLTGYEINQIANVVTKMRLMIHNSDLDLHRENVLQVSMKKKYDLAFSDYPWALRTTKDVEDDENMIVEYQRNRMKADWNFIFKAINSINKNGKAIVIVPEGALFNIPDKVSRQQVIDKGLLEMIIKMPMGTYPSTSVQYSILVFSYGNKHVKYVDATECYIGNRPTDKKIKIKSILDIIHDQDESKCLVVDNETIAETDYNLSLSTYANGVMDIQLQNPKPIKEIGEILSGYQYTSRTLKELDPGQGNVSIVKITNIEEGTIDYSALASAEIDEKKIEKYLLKDNDILISSKGTTIKLAMVSDLKDRKVIPHNNLMVIRVTSDEVLSGYLCNFLNSSTGQKILKSLQTGSIIINITKNSLLDMNIPVVDMDTQETIINRYCILKEEITQLKERLNILETKIQSIYDDEVGE